MKEAALTTIFTARTSSEADAIIGWLRTIGLHPAELGLTTPVPFEGEDFRFPIEVPTEEAEKAKSAVENRPQFIHA